MAAVTLLATACAAAPAPAPTPTPTGFASEEEAAAAATDLYHSYADELNRRLNGDKSADPLQYLAGDALESDREAIEVAESRGLLVKGESAVARFAVVEVALLEGSAHVAATVCIDSSGTQVIDESGTAQPKSGPDEAGYEVTFATVDRELRITHNVLAPEMPC